MLLDYITERYGNEFNFNEELIYAVMLKYIKELHAQGGRVLSRSYGFISYRLEGDALILLDMYTPESYRLKGFGHKLFRELCLLGQDHGKYVIISFSEHLGQKHESGLKAMESVGFKQSFETADSRVFIRGVQ